MASVTPTLSQSIDSDWNAMDVIELTGSPEELHEQIIEKVNPLAMGGVRHQITHLSVRVMEDLMRVPWHAGQDDTDIQPFVGVVLEREGNAGFIGFPVPRGVPAEEMLPVLLKGMSVDPDGLSQACGMLWSEVRGWGWVSEYSGAMLPPDTDMETFMSEWSGRIHEHPDRYDMRMVLIILNDGSLVRCEMNRENPAIKLTVSDQVGDEQGRIVDTIMQMIMVTRERQQRAD